MGTTGSETEDVDLFDALADENTRRILANVSMKPMSAQELKETCDVSERTVYRRLDQLQSFGLLEESIQIDPDGHHRTVYETKLKNILVELEDGEYRIEIEFEEDTADRFARIWKDMRGD